MMYLKAVAHMFSLVAALSTLFSLSLALPATTDSTSLLAKPSAVQSLGATCQPPYPDHYGPQSCPQSADNPWAGGLTASKPSFMDLSGPTSRDAPLVNGSTNDLTSRQTVAVGAHCRLLASAPFMTRGIGSTTTHQARVYPFMRYRFAWCSFSPVAQLLAFRILSDGQQLLISSVFPGSASGSVPITIVTEPQSIFFVLWFTTPGIHTGMIALFDATV